MQERSASTPEKFVDMRYWCQGNFDRYEADKMLEMDEIDVVSVCTKAGNTSSELANVNPANIVAPFATRSQLFRLNSRPWRCRCCCSVGPSMVADSRIL